MNNNSKVIETESKIKTSSTWKEAFEIGESLFDGDSGELDKLILYAYGRAFELGLNIRSDEKKFLSATQKTAQILFQFGQYDEAINKLMILEANYKELPDWVNLYFASAEINTDNLLILAEKPELLFERIEKVAKHNSELRNRSTCIYFEFLNRLVLYKKSGKINKINKELIIDKLTELGINDSKEFRDFAVEYGLISKFSDETGSSIREDKSLDKDEFLQIRIEKLIKEISELKALVKSKDYIISSNEDVINRQSIELEFAHRNNKLLERRINDITNKLEESKEKEGLLRQQCLLYEKQALEKEEIKQSELESSKIVELEERINKLDLETDSLKKENRNYKSEIEEKNNLILSIKEDLYTKDEEIQRLNAFIVGQVEKIALLEEEINKQGFEEGIPDDESLEEVSRRREILHVDSFLPRRQSILIIGGSETKEKNLRGKLKSIGFDFSKDQLEFQLDYSDIKDYASRIKPWSGKYAGIIVGPCPHKAKDTDGYSSFIEYIKSEEGYPHVEEARDKAGNLKISVTSIADAMMKMAVHLQSIA